jgi:pyrophosphate--fructose-6-phosphate 1-phosphotransferase
VGHDEGKKGLLRTIEFPRIRGGKAFDTNAKWFTRMFKELDQPMGAKVVVSHGGDD